jgi:transcription elongation factor Elf1
MTVVWVVVGLFLAFMVVAFVHDYRAGIPQANAAARAAQTKRIVCPHCSAAGKVATKQVRVKRGISGGKVTGAVLTGGISVLGTGLSRKQHATAMSCGNCGMAWTVDRP